MVSGCNIGYSSGKQKWAQLFYFNTLFILERFFAFYKWFWVQMMSAMWNCQALFAWNLLKKIIWGIGYIYLKVSGRCNIQESLLMISWEQTAKRGPEIFRRTWKCWGQRKARTASTPLYFFKLSTSLSLQYITETVKNKQLLFHVFKTKTINWEQFIFSECFQPGGEKLVKLFRFFIGFQFFVAHLHVINKYWLGAI